MAREGRLLIRGARVLTLDPTLGDLGPADVLVEGSRIRAVAPRIEAEDAEALDATGTIAIPGFVDAHRHVWQTQLRGVGADWSLFHYFTRMRCLYGACYGPEDVYLGNRVGALEALNAGITTIVDHSHVLNSPDHADEAVRGLQETGIRGIFCYGLFPSPTLHPFQLSIDPGWRFDDARRLRRERFASDDGLLSLGLAPSEVEATPFETACTEIRFGREIGARRISCHVAMGRYDRGRHLVEGLAEAGLLGEDLLLVHGSALTDRELDRIAAAGAGIVATPETELQAGMGRPVTLRARARSVATALGVDVVSMCSGDMFAPMRLQLQTERGFQNEERKTPPRELGLGVRDVLELATREGARVLGLDAQVGTLSPGKQADLLLVRSDAIHLAPVHDPVATVVLGATVHDVDTVLVAGRLVKRNGRLLGVDWPTLAARLERSAERIVAGFRGGPLHEIEALVGKLML